MTLTLCEVLEMKTPNEIKDLIQKANKMKCHLYAQPIIINTLGMETDSWLRVLDARTRNGQTQVKLMNSKWHRILSRTKFTIS